jgi:hypothetical protein
VDGVYRDVMIAPGYSAGNDPRKIITARAAVAGGSALARIRQYNNISNHRPSGSLMLNQSETLFPLLL